MTAAFRATGSLCAFGKLPASGDFVKLGPSSALFTRFDAWLTDGVERALATRRDAWSESFRRGTVRAFIYRANEPHLERALVVGAITPSQDQAGRLFPLCIAVPVVLSAEFAECPHLLPLACEPIWRIASECLAELRSNPSLDAAELLTHARPTEAVLLDDAEAAYAVWSESLKLTELSEVIAESARFEDFCGRVRLLAEALRPRVGEANSVPLNWRLPLGSAGGAAVCFWLDVFRRLRGSASVPSLFWSNDGTSDRLTLCLGSPPVSMVSELWLHDESTTNLCDLGPTLPNPGEHSSAALPEPLERSLSNPSHAVSTLLNSLGVRP